MQYLFRGENCRSSLGSNEITIYMISSVCKKTLYLLRTALGIDDLPENFDVSHNEALLIYDFANRHDVIHLISFALEKEHLLNTKDEKLKDLRQVYLKSIRKCARQDYCIDEMGKSFSDAGIPYIPLKGLVMRDHYPERWMRTSGDIDVLVRKNDYDKAADVVKNILHYKQLGDCGYHKSFSNDKNVEVEIHNSISIDDKKIGTETLDKIWETSTSAGEGTLRRNMRDDFYYFHHIFHMLTHFENGGIGLRFFIDLYLLSCMQIGEDERAARVAIIKENGLEKFEAGTLRLAEYFFEDDIEKEPEDEALKQMVEYVIGAGLYGTVSQRVVYKSEKSGGRIHYIKRRIFMPYDSLKRSYPILKKHKILTPIYEVIRWCRIIFKKRDESSNKEIKVIFTNQDEKDFTKMREMLGL